MNKRVRTTRRLEVWLKDTSVALFVLNAHRRLVFFNFGCERLTGWKAADVLGQVCDYVTESDATLPTALLASIAPPAGVWLGSHVATPASLAIRDRNPLACQIHFYPLADHEQNVQATLGIIQLHSTEPTVVDVPLTQRLHVELAALRHTIKDHFGEGTLIARDRGMRRVLEQLKLVQVSSLPTLLLGESGTGRKHLARSAHIASTFGRRAFVPLDCRRLPAEHLETTLNRMTSGHSSEASLVGTVYLDQVDSLPRDIQRQVLEMIDTQTPQTPRVIAASQRPLEPLVDSDEFLAELHLALTPLVISVPSLRNRRDDLQPLAQFFLEELNRSDVKQVHGFQNDVWEQFLRYQWPGNVSELRIVVTEARKACSGHLIELSNLPFRFRTGVDAQSIGPSPRKRAMPLDPLLMQVEREQIELALVESRQNKAKAAELLGITRTRLYRRMEALGIVDTETNSTSIEA